MQVDIKKMVKTTQASITIDMWTDEFMRRNFLCATFHYNKNFQLYNFTMGIKSMDFLPTTGDNIKKKLLGLLQEFDVHNLENIIFTTDRGINIIKAL